MKPECIISGKAFLADGALEGFGDLLLFGLLLLGLPLLGVLLPHMPVEVLPLLVGLAAVATPMLVIVSWPLFSK